MISDESVKNEVIEVNNKVVEEIDTSVCGLIIGIEMAIINSAAVGIFDERLLFLFIKKSDKDLSNGSLFIFDFLGLTNRNEFEEISLTLLNTKTKFLKIDFV